MLIYSLDPVSGDLDVPWAFSIPEYWDACIIPEEIEKQRREKMIAEVPTAVSIEKIGRIKLGHSHVGTFKLSVKKGSSLSELDLEEIFSESVDQRLQDYERRDIQAVIDFLEKQKGLLRKQIAQGGQQDEVEMAKRALSDVELRMEEVTVISEKKWSRFFKVTTLSKLTQKSE